MHRFLFSRSVLVARIQVMILSVVVIAGAASPCLAAVHVISQKNLKFDKAQITIKAGDTITFRNDETSVTHNVYSSGPVNKFELKTQPPKQSSDQVFKEPGVTDVECAIHTDMTLKVTVEK